MGALSERTTTNFINLVEKETHRSRAFAHVAGKFPENLVLGATREAICFSASVELSPSFLA
jgi:hypothetical protein